MIPVVLVMVFGISVTVINIAEIILLIKKLRRRYSHPIVYLLSLSMADLLVGMITIFLSSSFFWARNNSTINVYAIVGTLFFSLLTTILNVFLLTGDRLLAVFAPLKHKYLKRKYPVVALSYYG